MRDIIPCASDRIFLVRNILIYAIVIADILRKEVVYGFNRVILANITRRLCNLRVSIYKISVKIIYKALYNLLLFIGGYIGEIVSNLRKEKLCIMVVYIKGCRIIKLINFRSLS